MQPIISKVDIEMLCSQIQAKKSEFLTALKADKEFAEIKPIYKELKRLMCLLHMQTQPVSKPRVHSLA